MMHEVLLALAGHAGDIIQDTGSNFVIDAQVPFLHESEKHSIQQLAPLGWMYKYLQFFTKEQRHSKTPTGLYKKACAAAVEEVLAAYEDCLLQAEQRLHKDNDMMPFAHLQHLLADYFVLFPFLVDFVQHVGALSGGALLDYVHHKSHDQGVPMLRACTERYTCYYLLTHF